MRCKMNQTKKQVDGALFTGLFIIILLAGLFIPVITPIAIFVLPIPFVMYTARHSWKPALVMAVAAIILSILLGTVLALPLAVPTIIGGIMIGEAIHKKITAYETLARGTFGYIVGMLFIFLFVQLVLQVNMVAEFQSLMDESLASSTRMMEQFASQEQADVVKETMEQVTEGLMNLLPFYFLFIAIIQALISQWLAYKLMNRIEKRQLRFPPFRSLRFPSSVLFIYLFVLLAAFMVADADSGTMSMAIQNLLVIAQLILTIQGFSFLFFFAHDKKMSKAFPIISIILVLLMPTFMFIIRFLGILDIGMNLRERMGKK